MRLIRSWLFCGFVNHSFGCIKSTLLKHLSLSFGVFLTNFESIIKTLSVQDILCVFGKLITKQSSLLVLMDLTHVSCLVQAWRCTSIKGPIVLVDFVIWSSISPMESGLIGSEVGILTRTCFNTEASWGCLRLTCVGPILNRSCLIHSCIIHVINIVECLVCLSELPSTWWFLSGGVRTTANSFSLCKGIACYWTLMGIEGRVVLNELTSAGWHRPL